MVEFIDGKQTVVERFNPKPLDGEPECGVGAHEDLICTFQEGLDRANLSTVVAARSVAEIPFGLDAPISPEPILC